MEERGNTFIGYRIFGSCVSNKLKESLRDVKEQLKKLEATREEAETMKNETQTLTADEIRKLR
ncbi:predicted protein [Arabidopsis lyrata subsp. lyrata]|uniref:Predicted protein n=1 Tax=Arabidopsis lyrata subsp. lyrata TaxID=81972 RepID=D7LXY7_ARALL|nr:predicted protein [Arabidopsis lyrata subsp. lyrata]